MHLGIDSKSCLFSAGWRKHPRIHFFSLLFGSSLYLYCIFPLFVTYDVIKWTQEHTGLAVLMVWQRGKAKKAALIIVYVRSVLQTFDLFLWLNVHLASASTSRSTLNLQCKDFSLSSWCLVLFPWVTYLKPPSSQKYVFFFSLHLFLHSNVRKSLCKITVCMFRVTRMDAKISTCLQRICVQHLKLWKWKKKVCIFLFSLLLLWARTSTVIF